MPDDPVSHVKNKGEHFEISDIISPTDLPGKTFGKDYILLAHNPHGEGAGDNIHSKGLKSLEKQASEDVLKRFEYRSQQRHFGNDPSLLYFRPVVEKHHLIHKDAIVLAVHPAAVNVFDQEFRVNTDDQTYSFSQNMYRGSSMKLDEYAKELNELPPGSFLNQHGYPGRHANMGNMRIYLPEAAVKASVIEPNKFVDHSLIDERLKDPPSILDRIKADAALSPKIAEPVGQKSSNVSAGEDNLVQNATQSCQYNRVIEMNEVATRVSDTHSPNNPIGGHKAPLTRNLRRSRLTLAAYPMIRSHSSKKQSKFCGDRGH